VEYGSFLIVDFAELKYAKSLAGRAGEGEMSGFKNDLDRGLAGTARTAMALRTPRAPLPELVPLASAIDDGYLPASAETRVVPIAAADAEDDMTATRQSDRRRLKWIFTRA
jgi:hypothetical protein